MDILDSALCQQASPTQAWVSAKGTFSHIFSHPILVASVLLLLISLPWVLKRDRWKKPVLAISVSIVATFYIATSSIFAGLGNRLLMGFVPADSGEQAEAIVVLGRGDKNNPERENASLQIWQAQRAPLIVPSGHGDALLMTDSLRAAGVPDEAIAPEPCSLTTNQNAEFTAAMLKPRSPQGIHKIILVTDPAHMMRSRLTFQSFGFQVISHTSPLNDSLPEITKHTLVFREGLGLLSYGLMGRYRAREVPPETLHEVQEHAYNSSKIGT
ncbi:MAG: YdcF family protein [Phormidesmis sp.]